MHPIRITSINRKTKDPERRILISKQKPTSKSKSTPKSKSVLATPKNVSHHFKHRPNFLTMHNLHPFSSIPDSRPKTTQNMGGFTHRANQSSMPNLRVQTVQTMEEVEEDIREGLTSFNVPFQNKGIKLDQQIFEKVRDKVSRPNTKEMDRRSSGQSEVQKPTITIAQIDQPLKPQNPKTGSESQFSDPSESSPTPGVRRGNLSPSQKAVSQPIQMLETHLNQVQEVNDSYNSHTVSDEKSDSGRNLFTPRATLHQENFLQTAMGSKFGAQSSKMGNATFKFKRTGTSNMQNLRRKATIGFNKQRSKAVHKESSYDNIDLQNDLIRIFGTTTSDIPGKPNQDMISTVFRAFDRLCSVKGNLQYYFQLMSNIMRKSIFSKVIELPEILIEQLKEKDLQFYSNPNNMIPYFKANEELLLSLNRVIRKAQHVERDSLAKVLDFQAELRGNKEYIKQLEKEISDFKSLSKNKTYERFVLLTEHSAKLTKEINIQNFKIESQKESIKKLELANKAFEEEISLLKQENREMRADYQKLNKRYETQSQELSSKTIELSKKTIGASSKNIC